MAKLNLSISLERIFRLTEIQKKALRKLGLETVEDLLRYLPQRYINAASIKPIREILPKERVALEGKVTALDAKKTWAKRLNITEARVADSTGEIRAVWFHQPYVSKVIALGDLVRLEGIASEKKGALYISNPLFEKISRLSYHGASSAPLIPVYPATRGVSSRWVQFHIHKVFESLEADTIEDPIPPTILAKYHLPSLAQTFRAAHYPKNEKEVEAARKRLAFEEIFTIQLARMRERLRLEAASSLSIPYAKKELGEFLARLPFALTKTQSFILDSILKDMERKTPMARLLEGDVGSGKTVLAAAVSALVTKIGYQVTYMAPTEILARQHFESFSRFLGSPFLKIGLLTSSEARAYPSKAIRGDSAHISKPQMLRWVESGEIKILIGTHALLSEKIKFRNLAFIVVDEQHRFGIGQRKCFAERSSREHDFVPHFLSMTATPIPRTLALTVFGDLDLSVLDELPPGRKRVITEVLIKPSTRSWEHVRREIEKGRQAFIICPRIDESEKGPSEQKSVKRELEHIQKDIFQEFKSAMLHGKMTPREKEKTLRGFRDGKINILVATSVIEVGIDIPNATIMIVEGADRFGLAQLHQLRGRIGRGEHQSYFIAVSESGSSATARRLKALRDAKNGFELAEYDLQLRGPGELTGRNQWGISDIGMEALKNIKMVEAARTEARALLAEDPELIGYSLLKNALMKLNEGGLYHFE